MNSTAKKLYPIPLHLSTVIFAKAKSFFKKVFAWGVFYAKAGADVRLRLLLSEFSAFQNGLSVAAVVVLVFLVPLDPVVVQLMLSHKSQK